VTAVCVFFHSGTSAPSDLRHGDVTPINLQRATARQTAGFIIRLNVTHDVTQQQLLRRSVIKFLVVDFFFLFKPFKTDV
jgi:hypothetical protein